jgi:hypothetical protein
VDEIADGLEESFLTDGAAVDLIEDYDGPLGSGVTFEVVPPGSGEDEPLAALLLDTGGAQFSIVASSPTSKVARAQLDLILGVAALSV